MFESLSDKLKRTLKNLRGEGVLTKEHVDTALREIRLALLEADVNYKVAKDFIASVKAKAEGQQVWLTDRKSTRLNSSHLGISYAVFCLKKKKKKLKDTVDNMLLYSDKDNETVIEYIHV